MSMSLSKGQSLSLTKEAEKTGKKLEKVVAGGGWDTKTDLDLLTVYLGEDGKAIPDENANGTNADEAVCFFNNKDPKGAHHSGDDRTGESSEGGDDEQITLTLADVPANVKTVAVVLASYGTNGKDGMRFGDVEGAYVRLVNSDGDEELAKYDVKDKFGDEKGVELGRLTRTTDGWDFEATGKAILGDFQAVLTSYGVTGIE